jgi:hypothetical protein
MSCCGSQRASMRYEPRSAGGRSTAYWSPGPTGFIYTGHGTLTVTGPLTGTEYRFIGGGPPVTVHSSDVASLAGVPGLSVAR